MSIIVGVLIGIAADMVVRKTVGKITNKSIFPGSTRRDDDFDLPGMQWEIIINMTASGSVMALD